MAAGANTNPTVGHSRHFWRVRQMSAYPLTAKAKREAPPTNIGELFLVKIADEKLRVPRSGRPHNEPAGANAGGLFPFFLNWNE